MSRNFCPCVERIHSIIVKSCLDFNILSLTFSALSYYCWTLQCSQGWKVSQIFSSWSSRPKLIRWWWCCCCRCWIYYVIIMKSKGIFKVYSYSMASGSWIDDDENLVLFCINLVTPILRRQFEQNSTKTMFRSETKQFITARTVMLLAELFERLSCT